MNQLNLASQCHYLFEVRTQEENCVPVVRGSQTGGRGIHEWHSMPGYLLHGHFCRKERWSICPHTEGSAAGWCNLNQVSTTLQRPPLDSAIEPVLRWSHIEQPNGTIATVAATCPRSLWKSFSLIKSWGSSAPTDHVPGWGVLSGWPNLTPWREKDPLHWQEFALSPCYELDIFRGCFVTFKWDTTDTEANHGRKRPWGKQTWLSKVDFI